VLKHVYHQIQPCNSSYYREYNIDMACDTQAYTIHNICSKYDRVITTLNHDEFIMTHNLEHLTQQTLQWQAQ